MKWKKSINLRGEDGKTPQLGVDYSVPSVDEILKKIRVPKDGKDGKSIVGPPGPPGKDGKDGKDAPVPDVQTIVKEIETKVHEVADKRYTEAAASLRNVAARDYDLKELKDVDIKTTAPNENATIQFNGATGKWLTGVSITVSDTAPTDPKPFDLWVALP